MRGNDVDMGGRHVLIRHSGPGWGAVERAAADDTALAALVSSLEGRGLFATNQDWRWKSRAHCSPATWEVLLAACLAPGVSPHDR